MIPTRILERLEELRREGYSGKLVIQMHNGKFFAITVEETERLSA